MITTYTHNMPTWLVIKKAKETVEELRKKRQQANFVALKETEVVAIKGEIIG